MAIKIAIAIWQLTSKKQRFTDESDNYPINIFQDSCLRNCLKCNAWDINTNNSK
jgi:hypothetical protein